MACEFCEIIEGRKPAQVVFENDRVIVFKDHRPQAKSHLLVCPKAHYDTFLDTPPDEVSYLLKVCRSLAEYLEIQEGFRMIINNGPRGGQIIFHLHVHFLCHIRDLGDKKIDIKIE